MSADDEPVVVRIELPLPMDVAATLIAVIGKVYPRTLIADDAHRFASERRLVLHVDQRDRHKTPETKAKYQKVKQYAEGWAPSLTELGPNAVAAGPHETLAKMWVHLARQTFGMFPDADNYIESVAYDTETHDRYVFYAARSDRQTPHALRKQAERRAEELEARVAELEKQLAKAQKPGE